MPETRTLHELRLASDPTRFRDARRWLVGVARPAGLTLRETHELSVALAEACANVHRHAYGGRRDGRLDLGLTIEDDQVVLRLEHDGRSFDPTRDYTPPDLSRPAEGGYGIYLMSRFVDEVRYEHEPGGARIVLVKRRAHLRTA
jgi:anti-sigma regulatory factor (Ser/Thr protein kinase)